MSAKRTASHYVKSRNETKWNGYFFKQLYAVCLVSFLGNLFRRREKNRTRINPRFIHTTINVKRSKTTRPFWTVSCINIYVMWWCSSPEIPVKIKKWREKKHRQYHFDKNENCIWIINDGKTRAREKKAPGSQAILKSIEAIKMFQ